MDLTPVRTAAVAVVLLVVATLLNRPLAWVVALLVGPALVILESVNARDFVTSTAIVRERGLFRRSQQRIELRHVVTVDVREGFVLAVPRRRDLVVVGRAGERLEFLGVRDAERVAERIDALAASAKARGVRSGERPT